jgi:hypothetical protein
LQYENSNRNRMIGEYLSQRKKGLCKFGNDGIGDEFHYLFTCKSTDINLLRCKYITPYFYNNPNVYKMKGMPSICHVQLLTNVYKFVKEFSFVIYVIYIYILIDQFHINLFFVVSGLSPKSNRSKIRVVSDHTVWIISWRCADFRLPLHVLTFSKFYSNI